jgi:hypothetical protein
VAQALQDRKSTLVCAGVLSTKNKSTSIYMVKWKENCLGDTPFLVKL